VFSSTWINTHGSQHEVNEAILWADVESSGTTPEVDTLLELGAVISDMSGNRISSTWETLFEIPDLSRIIANSSNDVQRLHDNSGLWQDLWSKETKTYAEADSDFSDFILSSVPENTLLYFGGNSITLDRLFIRMHMPKTYSLISYRSIDVTSLSMTLQSNTSIPGFNKGKDHRGLKDALDSLEEYNYYLNCLKKINKN